MYFDPHILGIWLCLLTLDSSPFDSWYPRHHPQSTPRSSERRFFGPLCGAGFVETGQRKHEHIATNKPYIDCIRGYIYKAYNNNILGIL